MKEIGKMIKVNIIKKYTLYIKNINKYFLNLKYVIYYL